MNLIFSDQAWEDYEFWLANDRKMVRRIHELLKDIKRHPHEGIGKPEPLRHALAGWWSRRIDQEHRLVYRARRKESSWLNCGSTIDWRCVLEACPKNSVMVPILS